ncbi:GGDEF domain-containing protein [Vibrio coralliilyticus]|uniref:diguanylate cyclase n=1 Tax=Vibrio coralliilyticus TaxID=190893 RepID=A0AAP6ZR17_9VIBR|nr:GGDEF domain-containing protein [Vibrio coralliilyticus]AIW19006.1 diguanylate cyclase [Vibrio coralliilyticus]ERB64435.1 diguanylate cyclase [Vibrio coralliilyticus OCN008]NOH38052.1 GGDEF domain-containing protein [Vibrio coralliilyticus]NOJ23428.1 GGDEF domain-containing protein [Vibrio coralliilyticus]NRF62323.1 GGDEF domain-containing protein [Vibrio coralliilyticus]
MELDIFNPSRQLRRAVLFWLSMLLALMSLIIATLNVFFGVYHLLAIIQSLFCSFSLYVAFNSYRSTASLLLSNCYVYSIIGLVYFTTLAYPIENGLFLWSFLYPVLFYLILGKRYGFVATMMGFISQLFLVVDKSFVDGVVSYFELIVNFALAYLSVWLASHILEVKRKTSEASLGQLASRDALTSVYNRHALIHNFDRYRQESETLPLSLLVLDLDYFKQVNDEFGHDIGDKVLVQTAALIDGLSDEHLVYRIGGEEFCIALHNTNIQHAMIKAEQIRMAIERYRFNNNEQPISLTASIGIYQCDLYNDLESVLKEADKELYKAKKNGRNQVMVCNQKEQAIMTCS